MHTGVYYHSTNTVSQYHLRRMKCTWYGRYKLAMEWAWQWSVYLFLIGFFVFSCGLCAMSADMMIKSHTFELCGLKCNL